MEANRTPLTPCGLGKLSFTLENFDITHYAGRFRETNSRHTRLFLLLCAVTLTSMAEDRDLTAVTLLLLLQLASEPEPGPGCPQVKV